jgi:hypothetical protein
MRCDKCGAETNDARSFEYVVAERLAQVSLDRAQVQTKRVTATVCSHCFDETARRRHLQLLVPTAVGAAVTAVCYALELGPVGAVPMLLTLILAGFLAREHTWSNGLDYESHVLRPLALVKARGTLGPQATFFLLTPEEFEDVRVDNQGRRS